MYQDISCPYCKMSLMAARFFKPPFTDIFECPYCGGSVILTIGAISFKWMQTLSVLLAPVVFLVGLYDYFRGGHTGLGEAFLFPFAFVAVLLTVGYAFPGLLIGALVKSISERRRENL